MGTAEKLKTGDAVFYEQDGIRVGATVTEEVEGWFEIEFSDLSRCIVRPSRLRLRPDGNPT